MSREVQQQSSGGRYFSSPEEAVPIIADLLRKEDFEILAQYYELTGSEVQLSELISGDFFMRKERPEAAHPAGFWHYRHPFSPGFEYSHMNTKSENGVWVIHLSIEIDQGKGSSPQAGRDSFLMIESEKGWQVLPGQVLETGTSPEAEATRLGEEPMPDPPWQK